MCGAMVGCIVCEGYAFFMHVYLIIRLRAIKNKKKISKKFISVTYKYLTSTKMESVDSGRYKCLLASLLA